MDVNGNGNDSMGVGREWEQESHSRTPLLRNVYGETDEVHVQIWTQCQWSCASP